MPANNSIKLGIQVDVNTTQAKKEFDELSKTLTEIQSLAKNPGAMGFEKLSGPVKQATEQARQLEVVFKNAFNADTGRLEINKLQQGIKALGLDMNAVAQNFSKVEGIGKKAWLQVNDAIQKAQYTMKNSTTIIDKMWGGLKRVAGWQISSAALRAFTSSFRDAFNYAEDLNKSLNAIQIVTKNSTDQMNRFARVANQTAKSLSTSTLNYTDAALIYYQQGLNDQEVKERTDATIKMANVTGESAATVSEWMTAIWNNFDDGTESLEHYADVMTALGAATASSSREIAEGIEKFAAIGDTVGLSYENAAAALATVTATTRQSADIVGTAFKTMFARIQDLELGETLEDGTTLGQYSQALEKVGVNIKDANGSLKAMDQIIDEIGTRWKTLDADQQTALAQNVAGIRQYTQFMALMNNYDFYKENQRTANTSAGELQKQQEIYAQSWEAAKERVSASLQGIYQDAIDDQFFINLMDAASSFIDLIRPVIRGLGGTGGILSTASNVLLGMFGDKMLNSVREVTHGFGRTKREIEDANKFLQQMLKTTVDIVSTANQQTQDIFGLSQAETDITKLEQMINENSRYMTAAQQEEAKVRLDSVRSLYDAITKKQQDELKGEEKITEEIQKQTQVKQQDEKTTSSESHAFKWSNLKQLNHFTKAGFDVNKEYSGVQGAVDKLSGLTEFNQQLEADFGYANEKPVEAVRKVIEEVENMPESAKEAINKIINAAAEDEKVVITDIQEKIKESIKTASKDVNDELDKFKKNVRDNLSPNPGSKTGVEHGIANIEDELSKITPAGVIAADQQQKALEAERAKLEQLKEEILKLRKQTEQQTKNNQAFGDSVIWVGRALSTVGTIASSLTSIGDIFSDETTTPLEKTISLLTMLGNVTMQVVSVYSQFKKVQWAEAGQAIKTGIIKLGEIFTRKKNADAIKNEAEALEKKNAAQGQESAGASGVITGKVAEAGARKAAANAGKGGAQAVGDAAVGAGGTVAAGAGEAAGTAGVAGGAGTGAAAGGLGAGLAAAGIIVAIIAAIAGTIYAIVKLANLEADKAKELEKQAEKQREVAEKAKANSEDFKSLAESYKEANEELDKLIKGSDEYNQKLADANDYALQLLDKYDNLTFTMDGDKIKIDEESLRKEQARLAQNALYQQVQAQGASLAAQQQRNRSNAIDTVLTGSSGNSLNKAGAIAANILTFGLGGQTVKLYDSVADGMEKLATIVDKNSGAVFENSEKLESELTTAGVEESTRQMILDSISEENGQRQKNIQALRENTAAILKSREEDVNFTASQLLALHPEWFEGLDEAAATAAAQSMAREAVGNADVKAVSTYGDPKYLEYWFDRLKREGAIDDSYTIQDLEVVATGALGMGGNKGIKIRGQEYRDDEGKLFEASREEVTRWINEQNRANYAENIQPEIAEAVKSVGDALKSADFGNMGDEARQALIDSLLSNGEYNQAKDQFEFGNLSMLTAEQLTALANAMQGMGNTAKWVNEQINLLPANVAQDTLSDKFDVDTWRRSSISDVQQKAGINSKQFESLTAMLKLQNKELDLNDEEWAEYAKNVVNASDLTRDLNKTITDHKGDIEDPVNNAMGYAEAIADVSSTLKETIGLDWDNETIIQNFNIITEAANGSTKAIKTLYQEAAKQILESLHIPQNELQKQNLKDRLMETLEYTKDEADKLVGDIAGAYQTLNNFTIDPTMDPTQVMNAMDVLLRTGQITAKQMQEYFNKLGFIPEVEERERKLSDGSTITLPYLKNLLSTDFRTIDFGDKTSKSGSSKSNKKEASDEIERYHVIKQRLADITKEQDRLDKAKGRAWGQSKIALMDKEAAKLKENIQLQKDYLKQIEANYKADAAAIKGYGAQFDSAGRITNYDALVTQELNRYNAGADAEDNSAVTKRYEDFKEALSQYEETRQLLLDEQDNLTDLVYQLEDAELEKINYKVELQVSLNEQDMKYIEYRLKRLGEGFVNAASAISLIAQQAQIQLSNAQTYTQGIIDIIGQDGFERLMNGDMSALNGLTEAQVKQVQDYSSKLLDTANQMDELQQQSIDRVSKAFDDFISKSSRIDTQLQSVARRAQTMRDLVDLIGTDRAGVSRETLAELDQLQTSATQQRLSNAIAERDVLQANYASLQEAINKARADGDAAEQERLTKLIEDTEDKILKAEDAVYDTAKEYAEAIAKQFKNAVNDIADNFSKQVSGSWGSIENMQKAFERQKKLSDLYLQDFERAYELSKLNRDISKAIDDTDNLRAKRQLAQFQERVADAQRDGVQLSKYQVEQMQKEYDLLVKRIALEDAQNAKNQVRLMRDTEGRYGYMYTADQSSIAEAQGAYEEAQYNYSKWSYDTERALTDNYLSVLKEYEDAIRNIDLTTEEGYQRFLEITEYYTELAGYPIDQLRILIGTNVNTAKGYNLDLAKNFDDTLMNQILPEYTDFKDLYAVTSTNINTATISVGDAWNKAQSQYADLDKKVRGDYPTLGQKIQSESDKSTKKVKELASAFEDVKNAAEENLPKAITAFETFNTDLGKKIKTAVSKIGALVKALNAALAAKAALENTTPAQIPVPDPNGVDGTPPGSKTTEDNKDDEDDDDDPEIPTPTTELEDMNMNKGKGEQFKISHLRLSSNLHSYDFSEDAMNYMDQQYFTPNQLAQSGFRRSTMNGQLVSFDSQGNQYQLGLGVSLQNLSDILRGAVIHPKKLQNIGDEVYVWVTGLNLPGSKNRYLSVGQLGYLGAINDELFKDLSKKRVYATGGLVDYTGPAWVDGTKTRPEAFLNPKQTDIIGRLAAALQGIDRTGMLSFNLAKMATPNTNYDRNLQQQVTITAEFPNATNHDEIEQAFNDLINRATQYIY